MSLVREIRPGINWIGAIDWNRRLFDELIPLPDGTSYNSYLVAGSEKLAIIDAVDPSMKDKLLENLDAAGIKRIDYIVANHAEQDHSGSIPWLIDIYKEAVVLASPRCKELLIEFGLAPLDRIKEVSDGEVVPLGDKSMQFILAPWIHWPDTMMTYIPEDRVLFSCDFLGSHLACSDLYAKSIGEPARRYYAEIMMPFRTSVRRHLQRIEGLDVDIIAPSHGPLYDKPSMILDSYRDWSSDDVKNEVLIPYTSMHGSTLAMVDELSSRLISKGLSVKVFDLTKTDIGVLASAMVDAATIVIGSSTVLTGPHPKVVYAAVLANALRPKTRFASIIGSYGWGGNMVQNIIALLPNLKVELIEPVVIKGYPMEQDKAALDQLAEKILQKHRLAGIAK
jgi:flavorubredoxin